MYDAVPVSRVHAMYDVRLPQASATWDWLRGIEFVANVRSPLVEAVQALRAQGVVPVCNFMQVLPGNRYKMKESSNAQWSITTKRGDQLVASRFLRTFLTASFTCVLRAPLC